MASVALTDVHIEVVNQIHRRRGVVGHHLHPSLELEELKTQQCQNGWWCKLDTCWGFSSNSKVRDFFGHNGGHGAMGYSSNTFSPTMGSNQLESSRILKEFGYFWIWAKIPKIRKGQVVGPSIIPTGLGQNAIPTTTWSQYMHQLHESRRISKKNLDFCKISMH